MEETARDIPTSIMQFIPLSDPKFLVVLGADLLICQSFHGSSVQLVKHLELFRVIIVFVKELGGLDAPLEHGRPHAEAVKKSELVFLVRSKILSIETDRGGETTRLLLPKFVF